MGTRRASRGGEASRVGTAAHTLAYVRHAVDATRTGRWDATAWAAWCRSDARFAEWHRDRGRSVVWHATAPGSCAPEGQSEDGRPGIHRRLPGRAGERRTQASPSRRTSAAWIWSPLPWTIPSSLASPRGTSGHAIHGRRRGTLPDVTTGPRRSSRAWRKDPSLTAPSPSTSRDPRANHGRGEGRPGGRRTPGQSYSTALSS